MSLSLSLPLLLLNLWVLWPSRSSPPPSASTRTGRRGAATLLIVSLFLRGCSAANILILHPLYAGSHELTLRTVGDRLIQRGHTVTQVRYAQTDSHYDLNTNVSVITLRIDDRGYPCHRYVNRKGEFDIENKQINLGKIIWNHADNPSMIPWDLYCVTHVHCQMILEDKTLFRQLNASNFDLAIVDLIANECSLALARALHLPVASFWGFAYQGGQVVHTSSWNPPSLVPTFMSGLSRKMNFWQRTVNMAYTIGHQVLEHWQSTAADLYIKRLHPELGSSAQLIHDIDLQLVHTNFFVDYPKLVAPNTKYVGGMNLREGAALEGVFSQFVAGAEKGVVLFSLGYTGFKAADVPHYLVTAFLQAFSRLEERVIMRFDASLVEDIPKNVLIVPWFPQHDLLAHPATKVFVTHCGMTGVLESVYHGVPMLALPIFGDQPDNAARIVERGLGLRLDRFTLTETDVTIALRQLLDNNKYKRQVERFADMWRDMGREGYDEAVYWLELLIKYGNLDHLRINDDDLSLAQYLSLDVMALYLGLALGVLGALVGVVRVAMVAWLKKTRVPYSYRKSSKKKTS